MFENLNPLDKSTATMEILIMLIVAFILGFIIAWILRRISSSSDAHENCKTRIDALEAELASAHKSVEELQLELSDITPKESSENEIPSSPIEISEKDNASATLLGFVPASADSKDDLTKISGVGPFIEKKLNGIGIYSFEQISNFSDETVDKVTEAIEFFPGRIRRDNWIDQAKNLAAQK